MSFEQRYIGEILVRRGALEPDKLEAALQTAADRSLELTDLLVATHAVEEVKLVRALADEVGMEFVEKLATELIPEELIDAVPINFARQNHVLPLTQTDDSVRVAVANPLDPFPIDDLRILLRKTIIPVAASEESIDDAINRVYERKDETALAEAKEGEEVEELRDLIDMTDEAPVIRWVNNLFYTAVKERASDIHIEPTDEKVIVRYRVDGRLIPRKEANRGFLSSIVSRVKIEAGLNIAERRLPQDGRITKKIAGKVVDVRVSTIPTAKGERVVMRLLDKEQVLLNLIDLGFARRELDQLEGLIRRPNGIILVTGPTGSGKTTTLYACLNKINTPEKNILTAEDPVEYELRGIGQMQVQPKIGLTFASGMRSFLAPGRHGHTGLPAVFFDSRGARSAASSKALRPLQEPLHTNQPRPARARHRRSNRPRKARGAEEARRHHRDRKQQPPDPARSRGHRLRQADLLSPSGLRRVQQHRLSGPDRNLRAHDDRRTCAP